MRDVLVLGAGPAGSTAAHLLAREGHDVLLLEKAEFPRFHIGESLLPCDLPIFERLGFDPSNTGYLRKAGAEFFDESTGDYTEFCFGDAIDGSLDHAYQVERARFDHELAKLAGVAGAELRFGVRAAGVEIGDEGVVVETEGGSERARFLIDATGQDAVLGRKRRSLEPIRGFGVLAAYTQFTDINPDARTELETTGNIKILVRDGGWAWVIPLAGGRLSFGVVTRRRGANASLVDEALADSPLMQRLTLGATRGESRLTRNFAYVNRESHGARYACVGDAAGFLDPVFSSGVSLAMLGAESVADVLSPALSEGREGEPGLLKDVVAKNHGAYESFGSLIHRFYHTQLVRHFFFHPKPEAQLRAGLISLLAGDSGRADNSFEAPMLSGRQHWRVDTLTTAGRNGDA